MKIDLWDLLMFEAFKKRAEQKRAQQQAAGTKPIKGRIIFLFIMYLFCGFLSVIAVFGEFDTLKWIANIGGYLVIFLIVLTLVRRKKGKRK